MREQLVHLVAEPIFWITSIIGSVILSVIANLLTPRVAHRLETISHIRRSTALTKQARFLGEIILLESNPERLTQAKLDAIHSLLLAAFCMLVCLVIFSAGLLLGPFTRGITNIFFLLIGGSVAWVSIEIVKVGQKRIQIARAFERREKAKEKFARVNPEKSAGKDISAFLLEWDKKQFGVNIDDIGKILGKNSPIK